MSKKNSKFIEVKLQTLYTDKVSLKDNTIFFTKNVSVAELIDAAKLNLIGIKKLLKDRALTNETILTDEQIAEIASANSYDYKEIEYINRGNIVSNYTRLVRDLDLGKDAIVEPRVPVITIMGHVDHGKTTLLDKLRGSELIDNEAGNITQIINPYLIEVNGKKITIVDTPGHAAFSQMRRDGSKITDLVLLIVSAVDSVKPQTKESIEEAQASNVPIIVVITKIDLPGSDIKKVKKDLMAAGIIIEEQGGEIPCVEISAHTGEGIDKLLETINLVTDLKEMKGVTNTLASGILLESSFDKKSGNIATIIVQNGTLLIGDTIIIGDNITRIKSMLNDKGEKITSAGPGYSASLYGLSIPTQVAGTKFLVVNDLKEAKKIVEEIKYDNQKSSYKTTPNKTLEELFANVGKDIKNLNIIVRTNSKGSLNAIANKLPDYSNEEVTVNVISQGVGDITVNEVTLAQSANAIIYTFDIEISSNIKQVISSRGVVVKKFDVIYNIFDDVSDLVRSMSTTSNLEKVKIGSVEVRQIFEFSKLGKIAGSMVLDGLIKSNSFINVLRKDEVLSETKIASLKHGKDNVREVAKGKECGIVLQDFDDFKVGDILDVYEEKEVLV